MTLTMSSAELLRDQDFQAPTARTAGQGVEGLEELTDLERSDRLARMREGTLGSIHSWELVTAVDGPVATAGFLKRPTVELRFPVARSSCSPHSPSELS